jgi:hypothetical protein
MGNHRLPAAKQAHKGPKSNITPKSGNNTVVINGNNHATPSYKRRTPVRSMSRPPGNRKCRQCKVKEIHMRIKEYALCCVVSFALALSLASCAQSSSSDDSDDPNNPGGGSTLNIWYCDGSGNVYKATGSGNGQKISGFDYAPIWIAFYKGSLYYITKEEIGENSL